ncbi:MAG: hypothetical protein QXW47_06120 [Candidatus Jordarchaeales archaeon]
MMRDVDKYCASERMKTLLILSSSIILWYDSFLKGGREPGGMDVLLWLLDYIGNEASLISATTSSTILRHATSIFREAEEKVATGDLENAVRKISEALSRVTTQADYSLRKLEKKSED